MDPSASTIMWPRIQIPSTTSMFFSVIIIEIETMLAKSAKINKKRPRIFNETFYLTST